MSFPQDLPNPNQDNVYYSVAALQAELLNWFENNKVESIVARYKDYYLPTFVFDTAGAPNRYNLEVFPKGGSKESLQLDSSGSVIDSRSIPEPQVTPPQVESLNDGAFGCVLDPKFYVETKLKEPNDMIFPMSDDEEILDLLLSTKYFKDPALSDKVQNYSILKNLLINQLKTLPEDELTKYKSKYNSVIETINLYLVSLEDIEKGQSSSIDAAKFENFYKETYRKTSSVRNTQQGFIGTRMILGQGLSDLGNILAKNGENYRIHKGNSRNEIGNRYTSTITSPSDTGELNKWGHGLWPSFLEVLRNENVLSVPSGFVPATGSLSELGEDYEAITKYEGVSVFDNDGKPTEWYFDNLKKSVNEIPSDWAGLHTFLETFDTTTERYVQKATLDSLGGGHLLVDQAIMKAILKLCTTNIDVNEYASKDSEGANFFSVIGRPPSLGPAGVTPWPSKYVIDPESYRVKPYTNNGFLCFHALIALVNRIGRDSDNMSFLVDNITSPDSDHDSMIKLARALHNGYEDSRTHDESPRDGVGYSYRSLDQLLHLYGQGEGFPIYDDVLLIPKQDQVPVSERSFIGWNLSPSMHSTEKAVCNNADVDESNYYLLSDDYPSAVGAGSKTLRYEDLPLEYRMMGFIAEDNELAVHNMRLFKVNYGVGTLGENKNVLKFFKHRRYSMPYIWACMTSLWRALSLESYKNLIDSVNAIEGTDIQFSNEELIEKFDHVSIWKRIKQIFEDLKTTSSLSFRPLLSPDGTISFTELNSSSFAFNEDIQNRNTPGLSTKVMMQEYVLFVSLISEYDCVQIKENHEPVEFDFDTYLPAEGLTLKTNVNFANQHGGSSQYIEPVFKDYYDKLVYTKKELSSGELIKKHLQPGPGDVASNFITRYSIYLSRVKTLFQHTQMFEHVSKALRELESFVSGFSVPPAIQESINSGQIELNEDLENPSLLKKQIETNKGLYLASNQGLGKRWDWSLSPEEINTKAIQEGWIYIHVIGLKRECWETDGSIFLQPEYINGESIVSLEEAKIEVSLYPNPSEVDFDARSDMLLRWLHMSSGLDISELTFSKNPDMIYSEDLIASDSGIFPWSKPDFEDGKPLKRLETIYNMSPWLFPDNMFNDICVPNEYHRVVACVITKAHLENANIGLETVNGQIDDIIGSIRWKKV